MHRRSTNDRRTSRPQHRNMLLLLLVAAMSLAAACGGSTGQTTGAASSDATSDGAPTAATPAAAATVAVEQTVAATPEPTATPTTAAEPEASEQLEDQSALDHDHEADGSHVDDDATTSVYAALPECQGRDVAFSLYVDPSSMVCDGEFLYIEADNLADHEMMVGITAWNEQVPLPQLFVGSNSWAIPLYPAFNETTTPTTGQGPIAVAINGVMIFNPTQQSGIYSEQSDPNLIGELDYCGGHAGRGDDYHYHVSPVCLGGDLLVTDDAFEGIVAYAMDGYPIYANAAIPVGAELDECGGLGTSAADYRYFATDTFPYVNGCFRGDYTMDLQPQAPPIRDAGTPRQTEITANYIDDQGVNHLEYLDEGVAASINWISNGEDCFDFEFVDDVSTGLVRRAETYCRSAEAQRPGG